MRVLSIPYSTWDAVISANGFKVYHVEPTNPDYSTLKRKSWAGTSDFIYHTDVDDSDFGNGSDGLYQDKYEADAVTVVSEDEAIASIVGLIPGKPVPKEADGKQVIVQSPSTEGLMTWITSAGDDLSPTPPASGRGDGQKVRISFTTIEEKYIDVQFLEPVELHDGSLWYTPVANWDVDSWFSFSAIIPATVTTPNGTNEGNCNLIDLGGYNLIVPAAGDGTHDIDLDQAVPVPATNKDGYWDAHNLTGAITPSLTPGMSKWHLFDIAFESFFLKEIALGHPEGVFEIDVYKAEWISERWSLRIRVNKASDSVGEVAGWLMMFREFST